ncbi:hypothetical protein B0H15DRAFT_409521 [Mycena belliarum]|uniref:Uncharacterized protein n=1 Tax=Mycena belliarum TaxID=1033014 RepID=A0AAD6Y0N2_9AGAR|nr:hypothetical protein B0H15DRAFT_409521 [Mycena belliae]
MCGSGRCRFPGSCVPSALRTPGSMPLLASGFCQAFRRTYRCSTPCPLRSWLRRSTGGATGIDTFASLAALGLCRRAFIVHTRPPASFALNVCLVVLQLVRLACRRKHLAVCTIFLLPFSLSFLFACFASLPTDNDLIYQKCCMYPGKSLPHRLDTSSFVMSLRHNPADFGLVGSCDLHIRTTDQAMPIRWLCRIFTPRLFGVYSGLYQIHRTQEVLNLLVKGDSRHPRDMRI